MDNASSLPIGLTEPNFATTLNGKCLDRSITDAVDNACDLEFARRLALRPTQGVLIRLKEFLYIKPEMFGRQSYLRRYVEGKTKTHTRAMYTDAKYRIGIIYQCAIGENWEIDSKEYKLALKDATTSYTHLRCPCCVNLISESNLQGIGTTNHPFTSHAGKSSGLYGNSRHYQFYCMNNQVKAVREHMLQLLEDNLTYLFKLASNWGKQGFSTLLSRVTQRLLSLGKMSPTRSPMTLSYAGHWFTSSVSYRQMRTQILNLTMELTLRVICFQWASFQLIYKMSFYNLQKN